MRSSMVCLGLSGARPAGCGPRQRVTRGRGASRPFSVVRWEADALRDVVRDYALETLADPEAVLVVDETGFLKQGKASCGVARQYTGSAGKITNCPIGGFAAHGPRDGPAPRRPALFPPHAWVRDPAPPAA